jgi:hypothetical protein
MRPALISRSASLCIASMSFGVGGPRWADLTINMKRIRELLLRRAAGAIAAKLSRQLGRRTSPRRIDTRFLTARHASSAAAPGAIGRQTFARPIATESNRRCGGASPAFGSPGRSELDVLGLGRIASRFSRHSQFRPYPPTQCCHRRGTASTFDGGLPTSLRLLPCSKPSRPRAEATPRPG